MAVDLAARAGDRLTTDLVHDVVIVGAGIAGLAAAWELRRRGLRPLVLEQAARAGGVIVTERVDGYVIDAGPDSLLVQKPAALELCGELGLRDRLVPTGTPRTAFILRNGALVPLPEQSFLGLPTDLTPFVASDLFSWPGKLRMAAELLRPRSRRTDESIGSFIRRRFGREAMERLAEPLLAGIHAGDVDRLSIHALFPRLVQLEQRHGSVLRGLRREPPQRSAGGAFVSLVTGVAELPERLVAALGPETIRYGTRVAQVSGAGPFKLTLDTDAALYARVVIVAVPAWAAATMLRSLDTTLATLSADIPYASSATVVVAVPRGGVAHPLLGTGFVVPRREPTRLLAATWVTSKWPNRAPEGQVLLRAFLGGARDPHVLEHNDETLCGIAVEELSRLLSISGAPSFVRAFRWPRATPQYEVGHTARVQALDRRLARHRGVFVTGSGYRGTGIPDCIADARATAASAAALLG